MERRDFLNLAAVGGGAVFASGLASCSTAGTPSSQRSSSDFYFVQLSDTHWGFKGSEGAMQVWVVSDLEAPDLGRFARAWRNRLPAR